MFSRLKEKKIIFDHMGSNPQTKYLIIQQYLITAAPTRRLSIISYHILIKITHYLL